ncbi:hypothetical protein [Enterobacter mori]|nr:hypothetical protein [Enterobacter mori]
MPEIEEQEYIFRPYITIKGRRITRPNGGMFKIPVKDKKPEAAGASL